MHRRVPGGWAKHADFMVLDLISLQLACMLAYALRFEGRRFLYTDEWYAGLALILSRLVRRFRSDRFIRVASSSSLVTTSLMPRSCAAPCTSLPFLLPTSTSLRIVPE